MLYLHIQRLLTWCIDLARRLLRQCIVLLTKQNDPKLLFNVFKNDFANKMNEVKTHLVRQAKYLVNTNLCI